VARAGSSWLLFRPCATFEATSGSHQPETRSTRHHDRNGSRGDGVIA
jgi:hypothetical protein